MVDELYDEYLREWVDGLHPPDSRGPRDKKAQDARDHDQKRIKGKLYRLVNNVMMEIRRKEIELDARLKLRAAKASARAAELERMNLRLEAEARQDEAKRLHYEQWKTKVALETRRANEQQMRKERAEEAARIAKINRESDIRDRRAQQLRREDELFEKIAKALQRESDRRLGQAVEAFDLSDGELEDILIGRIREYAGAEQVVTGGMDAAGSAGPYR